MSKNKSDSYVFLSTDDNSLFKKSESLLKSGYLFCDLQGYPKHYNRIYYRTLNNLYRVRIFYNIGLNCILPSSTETAISDICYKGISGSINSHSLVSCFFLTEDHKVCCNSDFMGVFTHYYYHTSGNLILSDNILIIANLSEEGFSDEGIYDSILFKKPYGENTWYKNIFCLTAGTILKYDLRENTLHKGIGTGFYELLAGNNYKITDAFTELFQADANTDSLALSISAGSDSRSVLAGLLFAGKKFKSYSWGGKNYMETRKIENLVNKFSLDWEVLDFSKLQSDFIHYHLNSIYFSNGLIPAIHHFYYYSYLPEGVSLYEGYGGSEFIKGEHSDGMYSDLFKEVIKNKKKLSVALVNNLNGVQEPIKGRICEYLGDKYKEYFHDLETEKGKISFQQYLLNFLPSKIFGGIFKSSDCFKHKLIEPYFSPKILASIFGKGMGITKNLSLRNDFSGAAKSLEPQSLIVRKLNPELYKSLLDRNIKYSEWNIPLTLVYPLQKIRQQADKLLYRNFPVRAQVDYASFSQMAELFKTGIRINEIIPSFPPEHDNQNVRNIEVILTSMKYCSENEFIKQVL